MKRWSLLFAAAGLALMAWLLARQGLSEVAGALGAAGVGILWVSLYHAVPLAMNSFAWGVLVPAPHRPGLWRLCAMRWIGESVNGLLPVGQVGGEVVRARLLVLARTPAALAGASVLVDFTVGLLAQALFVLVGVALLLRAVGLGPTVQTILAVLGAGGLGLVVFYALQRSGGLRSGARWMARLGQTPHWQSLSGGALHMDRELQALYDARRRILGAALLRLAGWFLSVGEIWLALYFIGASAGLGEALILQSLGFAARSLAFVVPAGLGVQEGVFVVVGGLLGLSPANALAVALIRRSREVLLGVPGLLLWAWEERGRGPLPARRG